MQATPCENVSSGICGQWRPRSACASAQSVQDLYCPLTESLDTTECMNIGIKHGFSCINICLVPWEVLKTEAEGRGFQHLPRDLANVNAFQNHVRSLLLHKNWKHLLHFVLFLVLFCFVFNRCLANLFPRTMLVLGPGSTHLVTAADLWPRYNHIESCVAVH